MLQFMGTKRVGYDLLAEQKPGLQALSSKPSPILETKKREKEACLNANCLKKTLLPKHPPPNC